MVDVYCHTTPILMAKRFIDTDLFRKPFMRSLEAPYKALWIYLLCECDHAGVWVVEMDVAQIRMGLKLDPDKVMEKMCGSVVAIDGGSKWYLPDFVAFQYGTLNPSNKVHGSVIERLSRYGIDPNDKSQNKPLPSPFQGAKDKDKDKDISQEGKESAGELTWPRWAGENTRAKWEEFKAYRSKLDRFRYKTAASEQAAINTMARYYAKGEDMVAGIEMTMAKGWKFPVDPKELAPKQANGKPVPMTRSEAYAKLEEYRAANGIAPGGVVETHLIPADIYAALK